MSGALERIGDALAAGIVPVAIVDVDLTLVDNAPRTRAILCDWLASLGGRWSGAAEALDAAQRMPIVFSAAANVAALGLTDEVLRREALRFWWERFFDARYAALDVPMPGAVEAVRQLVEAGATVVYLTARPASLAGATANRFAELGFPIGQCGTVLVMKEDPAEADRAFKTRALGWIASLGTPVLCADNEPGHVNAMHARFPRALPVLVDSRHSPGAPAPAAATIRVERLIDAL